MSQQHRPTGNSVRNLVLLMLALSTPWLLAGCASAPPPQVAMEAPPPPPPPTIDAYIQEASARFNIPVPWIKAVMAQESGGRVQVLSKKGAMGLMQLMPGTWSYLRDTHKLGNDPYDPHDNIMAGTAYLREMYDLYGSPGFLAAYNAGPGRYQNHLRTHRPLPGETRHYVAAISPKLAGFEPDPLVGSPRRDGGASAPVAVAAAPASPPAPAAAPVVVAALPAAPPVQPIQTRPPLAQPVAAAQPAAAPRFDLAALEPLDGAGEAPTAPVLKPTQAAARTEALVDTHVVPGHRPAPPRAAPSLAAKPAPAARQQVASLPNNPPLPGTRPLPKGWYVPTAYAQLNGE
jgi:hypothetical protein